MRSQPRSPEQPSNFPTFSLTKVTDTQATKAVLVSSNTATPPKPAVQLALPVEREQLAPSEITKKYLSGNGLSLTIDGQPASSLRLGGHELDLKQIAALARAPDGSKVSITYDPSNPKVIRIAVENDKILDQPTHSVVETTPGGVLRILNSAVSVKPEMPVGFNLLVFDKFAKAAAALGNVDSIRYPNLTQGGKENRAEWYVLASYGGDGLLPLGAAKHFGVPYGSLLSDLMKTKELRDKLKAYKPDPAEELYAYFIPAAGMPTMKALEAAVERLNKPSK